MKITVFGCFMIVAIFVRENCVIGEECKKLELRLGDKPLKLSRSSFDSLNRDSINCGVIVRSSPGKDVVLHCPNKPSGDKRACARGGFKIFERSYNKKLKICQGTETRFNDAQFKGITLETRSLINWDDLSCWVGEVLAFLVQWFYPNITRDMIGIPGGPMERKK